MNRILLITLVVFFSGCTTMADMPPRPAPLTLDNIVSLGKAGKDAPAIIDEIKKAGTDFDITASQFAKLSRDGVPDAVLDFMQNTQLRLARREGRHDAAEDAWFFRAGLGFGYGYGNGYAPHLYNWNGRRYIRYW